MNRGVISQDESPCTTPEAMAWAVVEEAARRVLALPAEHPMEMEELAGAFHQIQRALMARPMRRWIHGAKPEEE